MSTHSPKVTIIPQTEKPFYNVGIYCRVSSKSQEQLHSLATQISGLTRLVYDNDKWKLKDIYFDIKSGSNETSRDGFQRLIDDCQSGEIDIVVTKSVSRFGRDTVTILSAVQKIVDCGVQLFFDDLNLSVSNPNDRILISVAAAVAQSENKSRSENVRWGIQRKVAEGTSSLFDRKCYGYTHDENGALQLVPEEAANVQLIFKLYLSGYSILRIVKELEARAIKSPTGKDRWCKRTIECMLGNEKYTGDVIVFKTYSTLVEDGSLTQKKNVHRPVYAAEYNNPVIISKEQFDMVQAEMRRRSNIVMDENGNAARSHSRYSSKKNS